MSSLDQSEDLLHSDGNGVYDISFFAASIGHSIGRSRDVHHRLTGQMSLLGPQWSAASEADRAAYLLELHECSHHALMYSTPAGVLLWRLNQVISRDIAWILSKLAELGIDLSALSTPESQLTNPDWQAAFGARDSPEYPVRSYVLHTIRSLTDVLALRRILFGRGAAAFHADLTFGELAPLMERVFSYLADRCEVPFTTAWTSRLPEGTLVFPRELSFNVMDIAEVHAISAELFALRAVGDIEGFTRRRAEAEAGPFHAAFATGVALTKEVNDLGLSPHQMQMAAIIACSGALDVHREQSVCYLEDELPWWRFGDPQIFHSEMVKGATKNCISLSREPLIGADSNWLRITDYEPASSVVRPNRIDAQSFSSLVVSLASLGLDLQIYGLHQGLELNWRFLVSTLVASDPSAPGIGGERISYQEWREKLHLSIYMIEYTDGILFHGADLDDIYPPESPVRRVNAFSRFQSPTYQLLAHLLNGAIARTNFAAYAGKIIPRSDVLHGKIAALFDTDTADFICDVMAHMFEAGAAMPVAPHHLTFAPKSVPRDRYV